MNELRTAEGTAVEYQYNCSGESRGVLKMSDATIVSSSSYFVPGRRMISRKAKGKIRVLSSLQPGTSTAGCFVCCSAPAFCPMLSICPCCNESDYIHIKKESSKYIYIREIVPEIILQALPVDGQQG